MLGPRKIDWEPGQFVPSGYHPETYVRKPPLIVGAVLFGLSYVPAAAAGLVHAGSEGINGWLVVPVAGPFLDLIFGPKDLSARGFLLLDGAFQVVGAGELLYGLIDRGHVLVRNDLAPVTVAPIRLGRAATGLGLSARFLPST